MKIHRGFEADSNRTFLLFSKKLEKTVQKVVLGCPASSEIYGFRQLKLILIYATRRFLERLIWYFMSFVVTVIG